MQGEATAKNTIIGDNEIFTHFSSDDDQGIIPVAPFDVNRSSFRTSNEVCSLSTINISKWCLRIIRIYQDEESDEERVIIVVAKQIQLSLVVVNRKRVIPDATVKSGVLTGAIR